MHAPVCGAWRARLIRQLVSSTKVRPEVERVQAGHRLLNLAILSPSSLNSSLHGAERTTLHLPNVHTSNREDFSLATSPAPQTWQGTPALGFPGPRILRDRYWSRRVSEGAPPPMTTHSFGAAGAPRPRPCPSSPPPRSPPRPFPSLRSSRAVLLSFWIAASSLSFAATWLRSVGATRAPPTCSPCPRKCSLPP